MGAAQGFPSGAAQGGARRRFDAPAAEGRRVDEHVAGLRRLCSSGADVITSGPGRGGPGAVGDADHHRRPFALAPPGEQAGSPAQNHGGGGQTGQDAFRRDDDGSPSQRPLSRG